MVNVVSGVFGSIHTINQVKATEKYCWNPNWNKHQREFTQRTKQDVAEQYPANGARGSEAVVPEIIFVPEDGWYITQD